MLGVELNVCSILAFYQPIPKKTLRDSDLWRSCLIIKVSAGVTDFDINLKGMASKLISATMAFMSFS